MRRHRGIDVLTSLRRLFLFYIYFMWFYI